MAIAALPDAATNIALGVGAALLLGLVAAAVILALEDLFLRRIVNRTAIERWIDDVGAKLIAQRAERLVKAFGIPGLLDASLVSSEHRGWLRLERWGFALDLPPRQMLGVAAAAVRNDLANDAIASLTLGLAAAGTAIAHPSGIEDEGAFGRYLKTQLAQAHTPRAVLSVPGAAGFRPPSDTLGAAAPAGASEPVSADPAGSHGEVEREAASAFLLRHGDRALDALQAALASQWARSRYLTGFAIVLVISFFLQDARTTAEPGILAAWAQGFVHGGQNLAVLLMAVAFAPILIGPLDRLIQRVV